MTQLYWNVFQNLEREFIDLTDTIYVNDEQQSVYSMRIADLLIRTVIEIEAIAKELYLTNGGVVLSDEEMYFDTVCMAYLDNLWKLDRKVVFVVSPNIFFEKEENIILHPLHKANKRGKSSADWNKAYQAVKHNRLKELSKGSIKNLLHGLAALYMLNLYYKDEIFEGLLTNEKSKVDRSFGSKLFAIKIHGVNSLKSDGSYTKNSEYDECVYIEDHEAKSKQIAINAIKAMNEYEIKATSEELKKLAKEKASKGEQITAEWIKAERSKLFSKLLPIRDYKLSKQLSDGLGQLRYNIVLNKQQY